MIRCRMDIFALIVLVACSSFAGAEPADLGTLKDKLSQPIDSKYLSAPLDKVLEDIQQQSGVPVVLDKGLRLDQTSDSISLTAQKMPATSVLNWVTRSAGLDWDVREGVVFVSSRREIMRPHIKLEVYDVRALTVAPPNFSGAPNLDVNSALSNTSSGGSSGGAAQSSTTLFGDEDVVVDTIGISPDEFADMIRDSVVPSEWSKSGGDLGVSLQAAGNGLMVVKHTPEVHAQIKSLLDKYQKSSGKMIAIEARLMVIPSNALDAMLSKVKNKLVLDDKEADAFLKASDPLKAGVRVLGIGRTIGMNGQRVNITNLESQTFLADLEPVSGGTGFDPTLSVLSSGNVIDIEPIISFDDQSVIMTVRCQAAAGRTDDTTAIPGGVASDTSTPPAGAKKNQAQRMAPAEAKLNLPGQDHLSFRTTVRVAAGGAVILSGVSSQFKQIQAPNAEVVLFLRAHAIKPSSNKAPAEEKPKPNNAQKKP